MCYWRLRLNACDCSFLLLVSQLELNSLVQEHEKSQKKKKNFES